MRRRIHPLAPVARKEHAPAPRPTSLDPKVDRALRHVTSQFSRAGLSQPQLAELRSRLHDELRARVRAIGHDTRKAQVRRTKNGALSTKATSTLATLKLARDLRTLFDPTSLRRDFERCAELYEAELPSSRTTTTHHTEPSQGGAAALFGRLRLVAREDATTTTTTTTTTTPLLLRKEPPPRAERKALTRFRPTIVAWIEAYQRQPRTAIGVPRPVVTSSKIRERYLESILDSVIVRHSPGNTILQDYPVPESFVDALATFDEPNSARQLGFRPFSVVKRKKSAVKEKSTNTKTEDDGDKEETLLLFRPLPFVDGLDDDAMDVDDGTAELMGSLKPCAPLASFSAARLVGEGATRADARAACDELRWAIQAGPTRDAEKIVRELIFELQALHPDSTPEAPLQEWSDHLGTLAITGALTAHCDSTFGLESPSSSSSSSKVAPEVAVGRDDQPAYTTEEDDDDEEDDEKDRKEAISEDDDDGGRAELAAALDALEKDAVLRAGWPPWIENGTSTRRSSRRASLKRDETPPWHEEPDPVPLAHDVLTRMEVVWRKLQIDEVDRLDFICKYAHRGYAAKAPSVVARYEALVEPTDAIHRIVAHLTAGLPTLAMAHDDAGCRDAARHVRHLSDALATVATTLADLFQTFDERAVSSSKTMAMNYAVDLPAARRAVLAAVSDYGAFINDAAPR